MATININQKNVSDNNNTFFRNNRILIGTEVPLTGDYVRGDIIVNTGSDNDENSMWICAKSGSPGDWISIGRKPLITAKARVTITDTVDEVSIEGLGELVGKNDKLDVYLNSTYLLEDEDYTISKDGTKIIKNSGYWNTTKENAIFDFVLMKQVYKVDSDNITINSKTKLTSTVKKVQVIGTQTEVAMPNINFNQESDTLLVFKNGMIMINGIDYQISNGNLVSLTGPWNQSNVDDYEMIFVLLKNVAVYEEIEDSLVPSHSHTGEEIKVSSAADSLTVSKSLENIETEVSNLTKNSQPATDNNLQTESKTVVGAINELFQSANNGKELIASAIGEPLSKDDTFSAMSNDISGLLSTFKTNMINSGVVVESGDKFKQLIDKIKGLTESGSESESVPGIKSYDIVEISSSALYQSGNGYFNYSIESYDLYNISLILADVKAIDDDIGFTQYYSTILYPPKRYADQNTIYVGCFDGDGGTGVYEQTSYTTIPIMSVTDNFSNGTLTIFYKEGSVSSSLSPTSVSSETTQYWNVDYYTVDLNSIPGKFDYIAFDYYAHTNDADACYIKVIYDCNSKKCYFLIRGYYNYSCQFENVPSNAIPILRSDLSSIEYVSYTGFVANGSTIGSSGGSVDNTAFLESLKSVLQGEGVSVTDEDDMASLISKVDQEFDKQVVPVGTATASDVLSGKTFINSTGQTVTGTMANRGGAQTVTPGTSNKTLNAGYYSGNITVAGDADLIAANIVSGKNIFGVAGTATIPTISAGTTYTTPKITTKYSNTDVGNTFKALQKYTCNFNGSVRVNYEYYIQYGAYHVSYQHKRGTTVVNQLSSSQTGAATQANGYWNVTDIKSGDVIEVGYFGTSSSSTARGSGSSWLSFTLSGISISSSSLY